MKTALITGGTKGIGRAVTERLLSEGWNVIVTYFFDDNNANLMENQLSSLYPKSTITILKIDCSNLSAIDSIHSNLVENNIYLDAVLFNAGATDRSFFGEISTDNWQRVFDININVPTFLLQKIAVRLNNKSSIIFTGSLMGIHAHSLSLAYGVTKAAVHALVKNLVKVFSVQKIRVNAIAPGFVDTEWQKTKPEEQKININKKIALGRFCAPDELTDAYLFLITNNYVNGEILVIDGGYSLS
ncbi:SDR family oxidoreductase [Flavobacterium sp. LHD-80]|uniref:SDR family NAD(P)-dependent oxidoreductase n=1 Tax=Flavobacterium sp. LHD-80 TaxID=3071411 RepID=UPI0027E0D797|nr:SDR family oxidoreductase [Flavobacterium sp. LHD-80]MDQ6471036.1 SDR family oxidoreductase [Flavobacterium sp. LHD-80]